ncbi:MAG: gliding motility-associated C-terminal domain-containing protein [Bacteroidota bacterium]
MRKLLLLVLGCLISQFTYAQLEIEECIDPTTITLASFCTDACVICDIDGYTGTNSLPGLGEAPPGFCAGQLHNTQWVGFVAGTESLVIDVSVYDCEVDQDGDGVNEGLQIGIYNTTDCDNWNLVSNCDDQVFDNTTQTFTANNLTIGGIYFFVIDGAFGDVCSFDISVVDGSTAAPDVDDTPADIFSELTVCPGGVLDVSAEEVFGAGAYLWTLDGEQVATDLNSSIQFPTDLGSYTLCVFPYNPCDDGVESCVDIEVVPEEPEPLEQEICEGDEYELGGMIFTEPDVYDVLIPVDGDCDLLFELTLNVNPIAETFLEEEICVGDIITIGDEEFSEEGSYDVVLENPATGCDSIVYLDLTLIGTFEITFIVEEICEGDVIEVGGEEISEGGSYFFELTDEVGCDSLIDVFLTVIPAATGTEFATICQGEQYLFNGTQYSTQGTYDATISLPSGCDSIAQLNLTVIDSYTETLNESICDGESFTVGGQSFSATDTYTIDLIADNGCDSTVTLNLTVLPVLLETDFQSICSGETYTHDGNDYTVTGVYDHPYTAANGCDSTYRLSLTVLPNSVQTINPVICAGDSYSFGGNTYSSTDTYVVTLTAANGCDSVTTINLTVEDQITSTEDIFLCDGQSITIDGTDIDSSGPYVFNYTSVGGCDSVATVNVTVGDPIVTNLTETICQGLTYTVGTEMFDMTGMYTVVLLADNGCDSTVNLNLTVTDPPVSTTEATICEGDSYTFNGVDYTIAGTFSDDLVTPEGCDSVATLVLSVTAIITNTINPTICTGTTYSIGGDDLTTTGTYEYTFPSSAGCDSVVTVNLLVEDALINELTETICEGESFPVGGNNYTLTGMYEDSFITAEGCDSIVRLDLTVLPTVFTSLTERICAGEVFNVGGTDFDESGIFTTTIPAANGCDSVITLNLTVVDIPDTPVSASICDGGTFNIGDSTYMAAGMYTIPLTSVDGCDSLILLDLAVTDFYEVNLNIALCEGESYTVGTDTYTMTGIYQNNFISQDGCDSIVNLDLTVNPILRDTLTEEVCQGESFSIAGIPYNTTGEHTETISSLVTGCDSVITLFLTVNPIENITIEETICDGESVMVGDSIYTTTGSFFTPLITAAGCDSIVTLNLDVIPIPITNLMEEICDGESFPVGPDVYTTTGQYTNVLTSVVSGCDSIVNLDLIVHPLPLTELVAEICDGEVYNIGGVDYSITGMHQEVIPSLVTGCDSTITLDLTVHPVFDQMISAIICDGESVMVGDSTYTTTGMWPTLMSTVEGCDSLVTLDLTVLPVLTTSLNETLCAGESYTVGTSTYSATGVYVDTLTSSFGCDSIITLDLVVPDFIETFLVESICDNETFTVGTEVFNETNDYTVVLTSTETGCDSTVYLALTVNPTYQVSLNETICDGESFPMGGVDYTTSGMYQADLMTVDGCDSTVMLTLQVIPCQLDFTSTDSPNDCQGGSNGSISFTMITGTAPYTYTWSGGSGTITTNNTEEILAGLSAGSYDILVTDANGFQTLIQETVEEPDALQVSLTTSSYGLYGVSCAAALDGSISSTVIGGTAPYSYAWSTGGTSASVENLASDTYDLVVTDANGCTATAAATLSAPLPLTLDLLVESPACDDSNGGSVSIEGVTGGTEPYVYAVDNQAYTPSPLFSGLDVGNHLVSVQDANGCVLDEVIIVNSAPILTVELGQDIEMVPGDTIELFAQTSYPVAGYKWTGGPIEECEDCPTPVISPTESVAYSVTVTDENGCTATDRVTVFVRKSQEVYIPNAFSPDNDGTNDIFMIYGGGDVKSVKSFYVFNRWGESMFESFGFAPGDPVHGWDGRHRGELLNAGVYIYMAEVEFQDGEVIIYKGDVVLMK